MRSAEEAQKHQSLIDELIAIFQRDGFLVSEAEGREDFHPPRELHNDGYGDQENKAPDIYGYDPAGKFYIMGEAKTGYNDFESDHSLTQYNVFLDHVDRRTGRRSRLYVIVPEMKVPEFSLLITHYIHREYWQNIVLVSSSRWKE